MTQVRIIEVCRQCGLQWAWNVEPSGCENESHDHETFQVHRHLDLVVLPDNTAVSAASFDTHNPYARDRPPDYGLYLDPRWQPPWEHHHVDWPDFGIPAARLLRETLGAVLERARSGQHIEIGCFGGHGRTGTALACLTVLSGHPGHDAVRWVRENYCPNAVETEEQATFVSSWAG